MTPRLVLRYEKSVFGDEYRVMITEQDEALRGAGRVFDHRCSDGAYFELCSSGCPAPGYGRSFWLRGNVRSQDNNIVMMNHNCLTRLAETVATFNGRKNVVRISKAGTIV